MVTGLSPSSLSLLLHSKNIDDWLGEAQSVKWSNWIVGYDYLPLDNLFSLTDLHRQVHSFLTVADKNNYGFVTVG